MIVLRGRSHRNEMKNLVRETFALRISPWNYILALGIPCLILGLAVIELLLISGIGFIQHPGALGLGMWVDLLLFGGLIRALGEEVGWRGFLLPRLQERMSGVEASFLLGLVWWTWHLPVRIDSAHPFLIFGHFVYLAELLSLSVIMTWLRNATKGSLVPVTVFHATFNAGLGTLELPNDQWILSRWHLCLALMLLLSAGLVLVIFGKDLRAARPAE